MEIARSHPGYTAVLNGRFKGGYITRQYGRPSQGVHAIQLELAQVIYMHEEHPYPFEESRAAALQPLLIEMLRALLRP
jgi:N-formylglutamate deformylase